MRILCGTILTAATMATSTAVAADVGDSIPVQGVTQAWRPSVRWRGFNLLGMFCQTKMENGDKRISGYFPEDRFQWMEEWGFNFARLPLDYRSAASPPEFGKRSTGKEPHGENVFSCSDARRCRRDVCRGALCFEHGRRFRRRQDARDRVAVAQEAQRRPAGRRHRAPSCQGAACGHRRRAEELSTSDFDFVVHCLFSLSVDSW